MSISEIFFVDNIFRPLLVIMNIHFFTFLLVNLYIDWNAPVDNPECRADENVTLLEKKDTWILSPWEILSSTAIMLLVYHFLFPKKFKPRPCSWKWEKAVGR